MELAWEEAPPGYLNINNNNPIRFVAPYLPARDLVAASRVSKAWEKEVVACLWGNPAALFIHNEERLYAALARYIRTCGQARFATRVHTHSLYLPPAPRERYDSPPNTWLYHLLDRLGLTSLVVRGLPFLDHAALSRPAPTSSSVPKHIEDTDKTFGLRLLDISHCENATTTGLIALLTRLPELMYLDLSYTRAARDTRVLVQLGRNKALRILRLRGISLRDKEVDTLATAIGVRIRSIDLSRNKLSDRAAAILSERCMLPYETAEARASRRLEARDAFEVWDRLDHETVKTYQGEYLESYVRHQSTSQFVHQFAFEVSPDSGLTHLHLTHNHLTGKGISLLLQCRRLHVLDASNNAPAQSAAGARLQLDMDSGFVHDGIVASLSQTGDSLAYLKLDHRTLFTHRPRSEPVLHAPPQLPPRSGQQEFSHHLPPSYDTAVSSAIIAGPEPTPTVLPPITSHSLLSSPHNRRFMTDSTVYTPLFTPHLRKLSLTQFPSHSPDSKLAERLIVFISECATEARLAYAASQASYASSIGMRMSNRQRRDLARRAAESTFALETIVLEVVDTSQRSDQISAPQSGSAWLDRGRAGNAVAVTGDLDSNNLWRAAEQDFSFFDTGSGTRTEDWTSSASEDRRRSEVDNIAMLSVFRRNKKSEYARRVAKEGPEVEVKGYWPGVVTVIRTGGSKEADALDHELGIGYYRRMYA